MDPYLNLVINFVIAAIKCFVGGYIFAQIGPQIKKAWMKQKKWKLTFSIGMLLLCYYILFIGLL